MILQTFSKVSGSRTNAQPLEKLSKFRQAVIITSDPAYFGLLSFMSISHNINLLLLNVGM